MKSAERTRVLRTYRRTVPPEGSVRMDLNENIFVTPDELILAPKEQMLYPDESPLLMKLAAEWDTSADSVILFNGASEGIMCSALAFADPLERVIVSEPEFALIPHYLRLAGAVPVGIPLEKGLEFDLLSIKKALGKGAAILFTAVPHNPSGANIENSVILDWCTSFPETLFIIDEAYGAFTESRLVKHAPDLPNLLVIRSFSKDTALAGVRLGGACGSVDLIQVLRKVRTPYSINAAAIKAGLVNTRESGPLNDLQKCLRYLCSRTRMAGLEVKEGRANFFLITDENAADFCRICRNEGVILRLLGDGAVRVSPADREGNGRYLRCLDIWRETRCAR